MSTAAIGREKPAKSLHQASREGEIEKVASLISNRADDGAKAKFSGTALSAKSMTTSRPGLWSRLKDMPQPREQHGFEALNGILYVVCGQSAPRTHKRDVYAYNMNTNTWTTKAPAPIPMQSPILRAVNGRLYLIGGYDSTIPLKYDTTFEYDPAADTWTRKANMPTAREDMASAVIDGRIYVFGGITNPGSNITDTVEVYDPPTDTWQSKTKMPNPRCLGDFGCAYNGTVFLVSGTDTMKGYGAHLYPGKRVDQYDPADNIWTRRADIPTPSCYKEVEELNGRLYVISGATESINHHTPRMEVYDITDDTWTAGPDAPYAARAAGLAKHNGKIYLSGGFSFGRYFKSLYSFDPSAAPANAELTKPLHQAEADGNIKQVKSLTPKESQESPCLKAVREFADSVLKYGRDTYGPKHTPLFVDGLNIHTHEPPKWKRDGNVWILSNLASHQNLFRTLDALTNVTGDKKYRQEAVQAIEYAFENLITPNGLLYWGGHIAYDAQADALCTEQYQHELKCHYPYYELMWQVNPQATQKFLEAFWAAHILNWSNLEMNRHGSTKKSIAYPWRNQYKGGPVFFWGTGLSFINTGSDLFYAGAMLSKLSGQKEPLIWSKRLAFRYVETRNPETGIGGYQFSQSKTAHCNGPAVRGDRAKYQYGDDFKGHFVVEGTLFPCYGDTPVVRPRICQFLLGEMLGAQGKEFTQWALEELTAWGKAAYRKKDNSFIPMLTDGTSMEGYVCKKDGYFGPKGRVLKAGRAGTIDFWTYALAHRVTGDKFMWEMARNIAQGNGYGDIGRTANSEPKLNIRTDSSSAELLLAFLELYKKTEKPTYIKMAERIGDNILTHQFHKGFFVKSKEHLFCKFDTVAPLVLLHLDAVIHQKSTILPHVWPGRSYFHCPHDGVGRTYDNSVIYNRRIGSKPPADDNTMDSQEQSPLAVDLKVNKT